MALSGSAASNFSSADCSRVNRLEVSFFIGFPLVGGGLPRADNAADRLACFRFSFRPSVNHQQQHRPNKCDSVPTITVRMRVGLRCVEWIVKHQDCGFERQAVFAAALSGSQVQRIAARSVATNMALQSCGVKGPGRAATKERTWQYRRK